MTEPKQGPTPESIAKAGTEFAHQCALFAWIALWKKTYKPLDLIFAIKNEEKSGSALVGARFKASGVKAGVSDIFFPYPAHGLHGLFLEMKRPGGKARPEQLSWGAVMQGQGYGYAVCDSWEKARDVIMQWMS